jgi:hypothetical protein
MVGGFGRGNFGMWKAGNGGNGMRERFNLELRESGIGEERDSERGKEERRKRGFLSGTQGIRNRKAVWFLSS